MIVPLKYKYRCYKPVKKTHAVGDHNQKATKKKQGPKTYVPGSWVMVMDVKGHCRMKPKELV